MLNKLEIFLDLILGVLIKMGKNIVSLTVITNASGSKKSPVRFVESTNIDISLSDSLVARICNEFIEALVEMGVEFHSTKKLDEHIKTKQAEQN